MNIKQMQNRKERFFRLAAGGLQTVSTGTRLMRVATVAEVKERDR
jgi:hypothetical protein